MKTSIKAFVSAAVLSAIPCFAGLVHADWMRVSAAACHASGSITWDTEKIMNNGSLRSGTTCAVMDANNNRVNVHFNDKNFANPVTASACVKFWNANGSACGPAKSNPSGTTGIGSLSLDSSIWGDRFADFPYLQITLPEKANGVSEYWGYFAFTQ
jgi:hypothetical protein